MEPRDYSCKKLVDIDLVQYLAFACSESGQPIDPAYFFTYSVNWNNFNFVNRLRAESQR
jgi:hypothetical protein